MLSHYYDELDNKLFNCFGFEKPSKGEFICQNYKTEDCTLKTDQRDHITLLRHYAFAHGYLLKLTSCKPEYLEGELCIDPPSSPKNLNEVDVPEYRSKEFISDDESETDNEICKIMDEELPRQLLEPNDISEKITEPRNENDEVSNIERKETSPEQHQDEAEEISITDGTDQTANEKRPIRPLKKEIESILMAKMDADFNGM